MVAKRAKSKPVRRTTKTRAAQTKARKSPTRATPSGKAKTLETYRKKRDFNRTPEPEPVVGSTPGGNSYLIQKHAARRLHYDFRLELDGVLLSWAVPNGPSLDPADKRLAVRTEDHPLEYGGFEGVIPVGEYGGGTVMLWDRGTWQPVGDPHEGLKKGDLKFILQGERLHGRWVLVRMKPRLGEREGKENWLLIKERDAEAKPGKGRLLTDEELPSVASGRSMDDIAAQRKRVWSSQEENARPRSRKGGRSASVPKTGRVKALAKLMSKAAPKAVAATVPKSVKDAPRAALPKFVSPELCTLVSQPPDGDRWLHEIKFDGYRIQARVANGTARLLTRKGLDWTDKFTPIARSLAALPAKTALIDGELVVLDEAGITSFSGLQQALSDGQGDRFLYYGFDLLHLDGKDLTALPLEDRKTALQTLLASFERDGKIRFSDHYPARGRDVYQQACRLALEGIVSKLRDAPYRSGRTRDWVKVKCTKRQELVVGGWLSSTAVGRDLRSVLVGYYDKNRFVYAGKVGTGFTERTGGDLAARLGKIERKTPPFFGTLPSEVRHDARWVEPQVVIEVEFAAWTTDKILRHAAFKGIREDKDPKEIAIELPVEQAAADPAEADPPESAEAKPVKASKPDKTVAKPGKKTAETSTGQSHDYGGFRLTHPDRVLWPEDGITKQALADYYASVADLMLPHIVNRPLSLVRCPDGLAGECFFQRHMGQGLPAAVKPVKVRSEKQDYLTIEDITGLVALVQFSTLEIHPWGARADDPEHPDRIVMDFDPHESVPWTSVVAAVYECRERLARMELTSFVKTTGGKGLHVVLPIERRHGWEEVRGFAEALATTMAADNPVYITTMTKSRRTGRIFIDYLRNARTSTAIAPYSTRARPGAPVAAPLGWDELKSLPSGRHFTLTSLPRRRASLRGDPWADMFELRQSLTAKAKKAVGLG